MKLPSKKEKELDVDIKFCQRTFQPFLTNTGKYKQCSKNRSQYEKTAIYNYHVYHRIYIFL